MNSFSVKTNNMQPVVGELSDYAGLMGSYHDQVNQISNSLMPTLAQSLNIQKRLQALASDCEGYRQVMNVLSDNMSEIIRLYKEAEIRIADNANISEPSIENPPTSDSTIPSYPEIPSDEELILDYPVLPEEDSAFWDYIWRSLKQILLGSFTEDSTLVGIIGSVLLGCTPIGLIADIRDILGDLWQFRDGVETEEVLSLLLDVVAIIPLCDLLKYGDEVLGITKYLDEAEEAIEGLIDYAKGTWKKADDIISKIDDLIDEGGEFITDLINDIPDNVKEQALKAINKLTTEIGDETVGGVIKDIVLEALEVEDKIVDAVSGAIDDIGEGITSGIEDIASGIGDWWDSLTGQGDVSYA